MVKVKQKHFKQVQHMAKMILSEEVVTAFTKQGSRLFLIITKSKLTVKKTCKI